MYTSQLKGTSTAIGSLCAPAGPPSVVRHLIEDNKNVEIE